MVWTGGQRFRHGDSKSTRILNAVRHLDTWTPPTSLSLGASHFAGRPKLRAAHRSSVARIWLLIKLIVPTSVGDRPILGSFLFGCRPGRGRVAKRQESRFRSIRQWPPVALRKNRSIDIDVRQGHSELRELDDMRVAQVPLLKARAFASSLFIVEIHRKPVLSHCRSSPPTCH